MEKIIYRLLLIFCVICYTRSECIMEGVTNWLLPNSVTIMDTDREQEIFRRRTQNIEEITNIVQGEGLNRGPYFNVHLENSDFVITTNAAFNTYENYETAHSTGLSMPLRCSSGAVVVFVITIHITDTNNHSPEFVPSNNYEFTIAPPVPPGFTVTDCVNDIMARDVDLTTSRIDYVIQGSPLFEIAYDESSTVPKEFKAVLRAVSLIRSIPEPITLQISATDVDETGDPARTVTGTITITGNNEFEFPDEPVFSQAFYLVSYTEADQLELQDTIYLRQGSDNEVRFSLDGAMRQYFDIVPDGNGIRLELETSIPLEEYPEEGQTYLVVTAEREYTSGAMATIVVQFPKARELTFENLAYTGTLEDIVVTLQPIILNTDVETVIELSLDGDYSQYFSTQNTNNQISINVNPNLPDTALLQNDHLVLTLSASATNALTTYTTIFLNIIKDDVTTPIFSKSIYEGRYIDDTHILLEDILVTQGLDDTVTFTLEEGYDEWFEVQPTNNGVSIQIKSQIPHDFIFDEKTLVFYILANKPRTVGANAAVSISFPDELILPTVLMFSKNLYNGELEENSLRIENIILDNGYTANTLFDLKGEYDHYFTITNEGNNVFITLAPNAAYEDLLNNKFIALEIEAYGERSVTKSTVIIDVLSYRNTMPSLVFENAYYTGSLDEQKTLEFTQTISLQDNFDDTVVFNLEGEFNIYFRTVHTGTNSMSVALNEDVSIPDEVIQQNRNLIFTITANKPESNPGRATIIINLLADDTTPTVLRFSKSSYNGHLEENSLTVDNIILEYGYTPETRFDLKGEHMSHFALTNDDNIVSITMAPTAVYEELLNNKFVVLEVEASGEGSITVTSTVVIDIISDANTMPSLVFENAYYTGSLIEQNRLDFYQTMSLQTGFDATVDFHLEGDHSASFTLVHTGTNSIIVDVNAEVPLPQEVIERNTKLILTIIASKPDTSRGIATIVIDILGDVIVPTVLMFSKNTYNGQLEDNLLNIESIILESGYTLNTQFDLSGEYRSHFALTNDNNIVSITMAPTAIYEELLNNKFVVLEVEASGERSVTVRSTVIIDIISDANTMPSLVFENAYYTGSLVEQNRLDFYQTMSLQTGFDATVDFHLEGDHSASFTLVHTGTNSIIVDVNAEVPLPQEVIEQNTKLIITIIASKPDTSRGIATIVIEILGDVIVPTLLMFSKNTYNGQLEDNLLIVERIILMNGYTSNTQFALNGEYRSHFALTNDDNIVSITMAPPAVYEDLMKNKFVVLEVEASGDRSVTVTASVIIDMVTYTNTMSTLVFENSYYTGTLHEPNRLEFTQAISLRYGFDDTVQFNLLGEHDEWFTIVDIGTNSLLIDLREDHSVPEAVIQQNRNLIFTLVASRLASYRGQAVIVIDLLKDDVPESSLAFSQNYYNGYIERGVVTIDSISLQPHPDGVTLEILGDYSNYFQAYTENGIIKIEKRDGIEIEFELNVVVFVLEARTITSEARTIIILEIKEDETGLSDLRFSEPFYVVLFSDSEGLVYNSEIILSDGYDDTVRFSLEGDGATWFSVDESENPVALVLSGSLPNEVIENNNFLILVIRASNSNNVSTRATIIIEIVSGSPVENRASFDKVLYIGHLQDNVVQHELITLLNHRGLNVHLSGEFAQLFSAANVDGVVTVSPAVSVTIPNNIAIIPLELHAAEANSVLLLTVSPTGQPVLPTVTFSSPSYTLRTDVSQTGAVGRVQATADNGEPITYSLVLDNEYLLQRLSVNNEGEIILSAPAASGGYNFQVTATAIVNTVSATAEVSLWVDAVTICNTDKVLPPLIVIERLEEEPHRNLVILGETHEGCEYKLTNHWPRDQNWLYVDNEGLHTVAIDREHESIAFMAVSQVQVELLLECEGDTSRSKRSIESPRNLGPYDYGSKSWILTDTILYNSRRSLVNLIVIDINDNNPVFVGKQEEPIYVGYPTQELEETILPRSLVELKATDADIGENAAIVFWTEEENLAVASATGFVHVRQGALLEDNSRFTVYATDQNGRGLSGSIDIVVKLLDENHIAVLTIRDAFLDDEVAITAELSSALGYDLKILKSVVVSSVTETVVEVRRRREVSEAGVSLQLYVYGINHNNPVDVNQLTSDINNSNLITVNIAGILSLEDHLQALEICPVPGRDTALLASTISLAVLLFILMVAIAVWFFLKWKKKPNYEQFSDVNSLASRTDSLQIIPKVEAFSKPRLDREELRKSEKRLQDLLNEEIPKPASQQQEFTATIIQEPEPPKESIIDMPEPEQSEQQLPIVIQSIDKLKDNDDTDDDEFGEVKNKRRKSVVTFNENVEKIIHIEDRSDSASSDSDVEVYRL